MKDVPCRQDGKGRSLAVLSENLRLKRKFVMSNNREETIMNSTVEPGYIKCVFKMSLRKHRSETEKKSQFFWIRSRQIISSPRQFLIWKRDGKDSATFCGPCKY